MKHINVEDVKEWSIKNGISKLNPSDQLKKIAEELLELNTEIALKNNDNIKLELGDVMIAIIVLHQQLELTLEDTIKTAHNKNTGRTGSIIKGMFVSGVDNK